MWNVPRQRLENLSEIITKGTTPTSVGFSFVEEGINFVKIESLTLDGKIRTNKLAKISSECHSALKRSQLQRDDILFSIAGALGRIAIVPDEILPANTNQALAIIRLKKPHPILPKFLFHALKSESVLAEIRKQQGGVAQQNLSLTQVGNLLLPVPPLDRQEAIVRFLDHAFDRIELASLAVERKILALQELKQSLLREAF